MKRTLLLIALAIGMVGCEESKSQEKEYKFQMIIMGGSGWSATSTYVSCDSFQMLTNKKAYVWVDGIKMCVQADIILTPVTKTKSGNR